jgi:multiple sugar transport system ATP-binding protein
MGRITLDRIHKAFGPIEVIHDVSLEIGDGELVVFVGPSGCGKSTLLRLISGLDRPTSGAIAIDGRDVTEVGAADRGLAMVFQSYALYPHMTVRQNLAFGLENTRLPKREIAERIGEAARMLEIDGLLVSMRAELAALHARLRTTMVYVTHDQVEAMTLADRIVVLRQGRIEQADTPLALFNRPANRFVAGFIGAPAMNFLPAGELRAAHPEAAVVAGLRPQHLRLAAAGEAGAIEAEVRLVEALGTETVVHGATPSGERVLAVLPGQASLAPGARIALASDPGHLHFFDAEGMRIV